MPADIITAIDELLADDTDDLAEWPDAARWSPTGDWCEHEGLEPLDAMPYGPVLALFGTGLSWIGCHGVGWWEGDPGLVSVAKRMRDDSADPNDSTALAHIVATLCEQVDDYTAVLAAE
ncbi:hypothetical protein, partial [Mycobacterium sp.]|uniref:hypothetical protein n=1 Tax=Mycobacterium sp. TaxID=1785 RepID=UPI003A8A42F4